jgi:hypothetical protein
LPAITLWIEGADRLRWRGGADEAAGIVSEHLDQCGRFGFDPHVIAWRALSAEVCGTDHGLCDPALATCAIYFVATYPFDPWTGLEKFAAGCDIDLDLRLVGGEVQVDIFASPAIGAANVHSAKRADGKTFHQKRRARARFAD